MGSETRAELEYELADIKEQICDALDTVRVGPKKFAYAEGFVDGVNPGLSILDYGLVGMPLSKRDAEFIISKAKQSPFGKKEHTVVDTSVRRSWELQPSQFTFENPRWDAFVDQMINVVHTGLNLDVGRSNVRADLYKMLLYEEGAFFKPHKDSEKQAGMFGTMIIALPSQHDGGTICLKHGTETYQFDTATKSSFGYSVAAWYADIEHEVKPVTGGYRLVLTYNLIKKDAETSILNPFADNLEQQRLDTELKKYDELLRLYPNEYPPYLVHQLEHQYTMTSLRQDCLKGDDVKRVQLINEACTTIRGDAYLATLEKVLEKDDEYGDEVFERTEQLKTIVDMKGNVVVDEMSFDRDTFTTYMEEDERDSEADESEHEGWTGNEGAPAHYWYRDTVVVIVPHHGRVDFRFKAIEDDTSGGKLLSLLRSHMSDASSDPAKMPEVARLCELSIAMEASKIRKQSLSRTQYVGLKMSDLVRHDVLAKEAFAAVLGIDRWDLVDKAFNGLSGETLRACTTEITQAILRSDMQHFASRLEKCIEDAPNMETKYAFIDNVQRGLEEAKASDDLLKSFKTWRSQTLLAAIGHGGQPSKADVVAIATLCRDLSPQAIQDRVFGIMSSSGMVIRVVFFNEFITQYSVDLPAQQASVVATELSKIWDDFSFDTGIQRQPQPIDRPGSGQKKSDKSKVMDENMLQDTDVASLVANTNVLVDRLGPDDLCHTLVSAIRSAPVEAFPISIVPFVGRIVSKEVPTFLDEQGDPIEACKQLVYTALSQYIERYVGKEPQPPTKWKRAPCLGCDCSDCATINTFLEDPESDSFTFKGGSRRRNHLEERFMNESQSRSGFTPSWTARIIRQGRGKSDWWQLTKNKAAYQKSRREWRARHVEASDMLKSMDESGALTKYLDQHTSAIMSAKAEQLPKAKNHPPLSKTSGNKSNKSNNKKRRVSKMTQEGDDDDDDQENETSPPSKKSKKNQDEEQQQRDVIDLT